MVDYTKQDMRNIWASTGDIVAPTNAKVNSGWAVEVVPRQYWNWIENRQDNMLAYLAQKGIPEWDSNSDYLTNRSYVQYNNVVYKAIKDSTGVTPGTDATVWVVAFATSTVALEAFKALSPNADQLPYFNSNSSATTTSLTPFARTILDDADADSVRATISAQQLNSNLSALSALSPTVNKIPYFTGATTAALADITSLGRTLLAVMDAAAARSAIGAAQSGTNADITAFSNTVTFNNGAILSGDVTVPNQLLGNNSTKAANTSFVQTELVQPKQDIANLQAQKANLASPALTGTPTTPTGTTGDTSTQIANNSFVNTAVQNAKVSPAFTGTPTAPTPTAGDNSTKLATTEFATTLVSNRLTNPTLTGTVTINGTPVINTGTSSLKITSNGLDLTSAGNVTGTTQPVGDNSTKLATTAFVAATAQPPVIGDTLVTATTPDTTKWIPTNSTYLQSAYPALFAKLGTLSDWPAAGSFSTLAANIASPQAVTHLATNGTGTIVGVSPDTNTGGSLFCYSTNNGLSFTGGRVFSDGNVFYPACLAWHGNQFVLVYQAVNNVTRLYTSPDGITWTQRNNLPVAVINVAYNGTKFYAGQNGTTDALISTDGITWTTATAPSNQIYGYRTIGSLFFAMNTPTGSYYTSPDGITWTSRTGPWLSVTSFAAAGPTFFVYAGGTLLYSTKDGINWAASVLPRQVATDFVGQIAYVNGEYVTLGYNSNPAQIYFCASYDGKNWFKRSLVSSIPSSSNNNFTQAILTIGKTVLIGAQGASIVKVSPCSYDTSTMFYSTEYTVSTLKTYIRAVS